MLCTSLWSSISSPFAILASCSFPMAEDVHFLTSVRNEVLDGYLAAGWYRFGYLIFTTHTIEPEKGGPVYPVMWLRYNVHRVRLNAKNKKLLSATANLNFTVRRLTITEELTNLHRMYFEHITFDTIGDLASLLKSDSQVYESYVIEVRDEGKLVAAGIFDKGTMSIAGIINFYDPAYKKYSPGKLCMLLKYAVCVQNNIPYYYPGYYSPGYPAFDYKLFLDKDATEVFIPERNTWIPFNQYVNGAQ